MLGGTGSPAENAAGMQGAGQEGMAAWRDDKGQEHRLQKKEQSTTGLQRTERSVEKEMGKGASNEYQLPQGTWSRYLSINTASK